MCYLIGHAIEQALTRRGFIAGSAVGVSQIGPMMCSAVAGDGSIDTRIQVAQSSGEASNSRTKLILLGTAGGPTWWLNSGVRAAVACDCGAHGRNKARSNDTSRDEATAR